MPVLDLIASLILVPAVICCLFVLLYFAVIALIRTGIFIWEEVWAVIAAIKKLRR